MNEKELYDLVVQGKFDDAIQSLKKTSNNDCARLALTSISHYHKGNYHKAKRLISKINENDCDTFSESVFLEAKMLVSAYEKISFDKLEEIADRVLSLNPRAAFARLTKSQVAFKLGNTQFGIDNILSIGEDYPKAKWIYVVLVGLLAYSKELKLAQQYVVKIEPGVRRILYYIIVTILLRYRWIPLVAIFLILGFVTQTSIIFLILMVPLLMIVFYGVFKKDLLIYKNFLDFSLKILLIFLFVLVLKT